jgi:glycoside/pentoside/hexuronide:cation symporter, GPH family
MVVSAAPDVPDGADSVLKRGALASYGALALPLAFAGLPVYLHAPDFYATTFGLSLAALGGVLLALRAVDAVQDPLIGVLSDRFAARRKSILLAGAFLLMAGFSGLFNPPSFAVTAQTAPLIWFALNVFVCTTGYSIVTINYQALGGLWRASPSGRTRITAAREALGLCGILAASILPTVLANRYDAAAAFQIVTLVLAVLLALGGMVFFRWYKSARLSQSDSVAGSGNLRDILRSPWGRRFYAIFFISNLASAIPAVLVLFYIRDRLAAAEWTGLFLLVYFLSGALSMPVWLAVARRTGKAKAWGVSMIVAIVTFVWAFTLGPGDIVPFAIVCVLSGAALGADLALPPAIVADRIAAANDQSRAASYFSASAFFAKASFALATGLSLPLLDGLGYTPGVRAVGGIGLYLSGVYALTPCAIKIVAAVWLLRSLDRFEETKALA